jgi:hypothetical protein
VNLTPTSNGCASTLASTQCTVAFSVLPGSYDATLTTYDGGNATGNLLSAAQGIPFVIAAGVANSLSISLGGGSRKRPPFFIAQFGKIRRNVARGKPRFSQEFCVRR